MSCATPGRRGTTRSTRTSRRPAGSLGTRTQRRLSDTSTSAPKKPARRCGRYGKPAEMGLALGQYLRGQTGRTTVSVELRGAALSGPSCVQGSMREAAPPPVFQGRADGLTADDGPAQTSYQQTLEGVQRPWVGEGWEERSALPGDEE